MKNTKKRAADEARPPLPADGAHAFATTKDIRPLRDFLESTEDWIWSIDMAGNHTYSNAAVARLLGHPVADVVGMSAFRLIHPEDHPRIQALLEECVRLRRGWSAVPVRWLHRDGSARHTTSSGQPVFDTENHLLGFRGIDHDVTALREAERELRETKERLEYILGVTKTGIDVIDGEFNIRYIDPAWRKVYGDYAGRKCYEYFMGRSEPCPGCGIPPALRTRQITVTEEVLPREGNRVIEVHTIPFQSPDGEWLVAEFNVDITERKQAEAERLDLERRLLHAQKLESLGVLSGGIAHDFNNLLLAIRGNLDLSLLDLAEGAPARTGVERAMQAVRSATELTQEMLAYSGRGSFVVKRFDLNTLVQENAHLFKVVVSKTVTMDIRLGQRLPPLQADPAQVQQVVMNLITNASDAIGDRPGTLALDTGAMDCDAAYLDASRSADKPEPGRFVYVQVADTGCGMDAATLQRLFDPFFTTKITGRGLGMSTVLGIVRRHKGAILVDSQPGQGTTVRVLFPTSGTTGPDAVLAPADRTAPSLPANKTPLTGTVLVADDEEAVREVSRTMLQRLGFKVITAGDGQEAVDAFREHASEIACVLLDLTMPRMDGPTALQEIRRIRPDAKVILCSGYDEQDAAGQCDGEAPAAILQKPYGLQDLRREMERVLMASG